MIVEDQSETVSYLMQPSTHGGAAVECIETHGAVVFLAGARALKLKRAVRFDYVDFSTEAHRRRACEGEIRVNRRTAPAIYRGVVAVTRERDGSLALNGAGRAIDWLVEMRRFDQEAIFDRLAGRGVLDVALMRPLAQAVARLHATAAPRTDHGGVAGMRWVVDGNARGLAEEGRDLLDRARCAELTAASRAELDRRAPLLERRREGGLVRECHGDLHLNNIVLLDGQPTLFDAVEFNDEIACVDVFYDLAFLLMDLQRRHLPGHANRVFNAYLAETGDLDGLSLLPLFLSCRAAVRAKTSATTAAVQHDPALAADATALAGRYLDMANALLHPAAPRLMAIGGLSGSGKSSLALALAPSIGPVPGAVVLRSDEIRKALAGARRDERLGPDGYTDAMNARVHGEMAARAAAILRAGHSVVADAVHARPDERARLESLARSAGVPFTGLWLEAPEEVLLRRVGGRRDDVSDADAAIVRLQRGRDTGAIGWSRIDSAGTVEEALQQALRLVRRDDAGAVHQ